LIVGTPATPAHSDWPAPRKRAASKDANQLNARSSHASVDHPTVYVAAFALFAVATTRKISPIVSFADTFAVTVAPGNTV
jgi:hypothetical protein